MASSVDNVRFGPVKVTYGGTDLGWTTVEGVSVAFPGHEMAPILVDQYGKGAIGGFDLGIDTDALEIKFELMENTHDNRALLMPLATALSGHTMTEGQEPGTETSSLHKTLNLHPRRLGAGNLSLDLDFHLCFLQIVGDYPQGVENAQTLTVVGKCILDTSKSATNMLYSFGGATS
jgi:hypothetical protein